MFYIFLFYLFLIPLEYLQEKIPKGPTGINYETLSMIVFTIWLFAARPNANKMRFTITPLNKVVIAFLLSIFFGMLIGYAQYSGMQAMNVFDPNSFAAKRLTYIYTGFLMFWLCANMLDSRKKIRWTMLAMAASAPLVVRAFRSDLAGVAAWHYDDDMRAGGPFRSVGSNELGAFFLFGSIMLLMNGIATTNWKEKVIYLAGGSGYIYGILYSYSRATQLAFGASIALIAMMRHRWVIILIALAAMTTDYWLPQSVIDRWEMTTNDKGELDQSAQSREDFWKLAVEYWESSPIVGTGFGTFAIMNPAGMDTHNIYYRTLAEQGIIGIIAFGMVWFYLLKMGYELWKGGVSKFDRNYGFALMAATFGMMIANYFGDRFLHLCLIGQFWAFAGIGARLRAHMLGYEPLTDEELRANEQFDGLGELQTGGRKEAASPGKNLEPAYVAMPVSKDSWRRKIEMALFGGRQAKAGLKLVGVNTIAVKAGNVAEGQNSFDRKRSHSESMAPALNLVGRPSPLKKR